MSSDIVAARREARRRKILDNSENRLNRITGRKEFKESPDKCQIEENGFVNMADKILLNGAIKHERDSVEYLSSNTWRLSSFPEENLNSETLIYSSDTTEVSKNDHPSSLQATPSCQPTHIIYITMAFLFRLLIEFNIHYICANSMVVSFLVTKCGVVGAYGFLIPETSRFVGSLLLLSGISKNRIKNFTLFIGTIYSVLKDFALYTFIFILSDVSITTLKYFLQNFM